MAAGQVSGLGMIDRRMMSLGLAGLATGKAFAEDQKKAVSPLAHGRLEHNSLAEAFEPLDVELPGVYLWTLDGKRRDIDELKGRAILMPLWAEWCGPCMSELPDFARLQRKFGNDKFAVVPILTGTRKAFTPEILAGIFKQMHCDVFEPLIENNRDERLFLKMARRGGTAYLPCNLIVAPDGHVVGREIGRLNNTDDDNPATTWKDTLNRTGVEGSVQSRWGQPDGEEFAQAMADGFLT